MPQILDFPCLLGYQENMNLTCCSFLAVNTSLDANFASLLSDVTSYPAEFSSCQPWTSLGIKWPG
jgi:hypothetical protein